MCRLFLCNREFAQQHTEALLVLFDELQRRQGGQGQGLAVLHQDKPISLQKAVKMKNTKLMKHLRYGLATDGQFFIYHTRVAVSGSISDANCMPFVRGDTALAHNGMAESITEQNIYGHSDTDALSLLLEYGVPPNNLNSYGMTGTYVGFWFGLPFVVKNTDYSDLELAVSPDYSSWAFASTLEPLESKLTKLGYQFYSVPELCWLGNDIEMAIRDCEKYEWRGSYISKKYAKGKSSAYYAQPTSTSTYWDADDLSSCSDIEAFKDEANTLWVQYTKNNVTYARRPTVNQYDWLSKNGALDGLNDKPSE